jgi:hypothetical protein
LLALECFCLSATSSLLPNGSRPSPATLFRLRRPDPVITGQDGSYLAELLLEKGYAVHGIKRRVSS